MWNHEFIDKNGKRRCAFCGMEFDPTDNPEVVAAFEMSGCPEGTFNPQRAVSVTASIDLNRPWIQYGESNAKDDPFYYRDFVDRKGNLCYCDGEVCLVHPWLHPEKHPDTVLMSNEESKMCIRDRSGRLRLHQQARSAAHRQPPNFPVPAGGCCLWWVCQKNAQADGKACGRKWSG